MPNYEQYTKIDDVQGYDLYFNDKRTVFIKSFKAHNTPVGSGGLVGGLIGAGVSEAVFHFGKRKEKKKEQETKDLSLDEKLQKIKGSFAIAHDDVESICVSKGQLNFKAKKVWKYLALNKEQFAQLSSLLPNIPLLKDKTKINY
ncbi:MAG: hypothetical protein ABSB71_07750 [Candidatus Bathyarchaeia archaeon]|jgi:hypothetical protein